MGVKNDYRKNAEGYSDPTACEALRKTLSGKKNGSISCWIRFLLFVNCPTSTLKSGSSSRTNEPGEFGGSLWI